MTDRSEADAWPRQGIENVDGCPVCGGRERHLIYEELRDRLFNALGRWNMYECKRCGCGYIDPRPNRETIHFAYEDYETHNQTKVKSSVGLLSSIRASIRDNYLNSKYGFPFLSRKPWWGALMYLMPPPIRWEQDHRARHLRPPHKEMTLLDIGCGNGEFLANAAFAGWHVSGIEPDPEAARLCVDRGLSVHVGDFATAHMAPNSFDVITSHQVIEHVHDVHAFIAQIHTWLKPGGLVWIGTPNIGSRAHRRYGSDWLPLHPPQHLFLFTAPALRRAFEQGGFVDIRFIKRGFHDYHQALGSAALARGVSAEKILHGVQHAPLRDRIVGLAYEVMNTFSFNSCSDLVMTARK